MSRFDFYGSEKAKRLARAAVDRLLIALERCKRSGDFGTLDLKIVLKAGEPDRFVLVEEASVKADDLMPHDER